MTNPLMPEDLKMRAKALHLYGLLAHWDDVKQEPWVYLFTRFDQAAFFSI